MAEADVSNLTSHQLAKKLLEQPDKLLSVSIDVSFSPDEAERRAFSTDFYEPVYNPSADEIVLLFGGYVWDENEKYKRERAKKTRKPKK